jgi:hypothetical protein
MCVCVFVASRKTFTVSRILCAKGSLTLVPSKGNQPFCRVSLMSCVTVRASRQCHERNGRLLLSPYSQIRICAVPAHCLVTQASAHEKELERIEQRSHHGEGSLVSTQDGYKEEKRMFPQERRPPDVWDGGGSAITDFSWKEYPQVQWRGFIPTNW